MSAPVKRPMRAAKAEAVATAVPGGELPPAPKGIQRRRGRPRDPQIRGAILRAARELLDELGPASLTMEAVAQRAGVGKPTVYRWWPNRHAVAMAALMDAPQGDTEARRAPSRTRSRSALEALEQQLLGVPTRWPRVQGAM